MSGGSVRLYRELLRLTKQLPRHTQKYYKHHLRQNFTSHSDETDPERIAQLAARARDDAQWVLRKYSIDKR